MMKIVLWTIFVFSIVFREIRASARYPRGSPESSSVGTVPEADEDSGEEGGEKNGCYVMPHHYYKKFVLDSVSCPTETVPTLKAMHSSWHCVAARCPCHPNYCRGFPKTPCPSNPNSYADHPCENSHRSTLPLDESSVKTTKTITLRNRTTSPKQGPNEPPKRINEKQTVATSNTPSLVGGQQNIGPFTISTTSNKSLQFEKDKKSETTSTKGASSRVVPRNHQNSSYRMEPSKTTYPEKTITLSTILSGHIRNKGNKVDPLNSGSKGEGNRYVLATTPFYHLTLRGEETMKGHDGYMNFWSTFKHFSSSKQASTTPPSNPKPSTSETTSTTTTPTARPSTSDHERGRISRKCRTATSSAKTACSSSPMSSKAAHRSPLASGFQSAVVSTSDRNPTHSTTQPTRRLSSSFNSMNTTPFLSTATSSMRRDRSSYVSTGSTQAGETTSTVAGNSTASLFSTCAFISVTSLFSICTFKFPTIIYTTCPPNPVECLLNVTEGNDTTPLFTSSATIPQSSLNYSAGITKNSTPMKAAKSTTTSIDTTLLTTSLAATPQPSSIYSSSITSKPTSVRAKESTTTGIGTTLLTSSSAATPHSSSIYSPTITSKPTSMRADGSTTTGEHHVSTVIASRSSTRAVKSSKNSPTLRESRRSTTGAAEGEYSTDTVSTSTRGVPSKTKPAESTKAEHLVTSTDRATVIKTTGPMPQTTSLYSAQIPPKSTVLEQEQATTSSAVESSKPTPHTVYTHSVHFTKMYTTFGGDKISATSEKSRLVTSSKSFSPQHSTGTEAQFLPVGTEAEHSATSGANTTALAKSTETMPQLPSVSREPTASRPTTLPGSTTTSTITRGKGATATTFLPSPRSAKSSESPSQRLSSVRESSTLRRSTTTLKAAGSTDTSGRAESSSRVRHSTNVTMSTSSAQSVHSTRKASEVAEAKQSTAGTDTALLTESFTTTHESSTVQERRASSKLTSLKAAKNTTTSPDATVTVTSPKAMQYLTSVHGSSTITKSTTLEMAGNTNTTTDTTLLNTNSIGTHMSSTILKTSAINKLTTSESTKGTDATMTRRSETVENSSPVHGVTTTRKHSTLEEPTENTSTRIHRTTSETMPATPVSSRPSIHSTKRPSEMAEAEQFTTSTGPMQQSSSSHNAGVINMSTTSQRDESATTSELHTVAVTISVSPRRIAYPEMKPSDSIEAMPSTTRDRAAVVTRSETMPPTTFIYSTRFTNKFTSVETTESATLIASEHHETPLASSVPSSRSMPSTEIQTEPFEAEQTATSTATETTVPGTATSEQSSPIYGFNLSEKSTTTTQEETTSTGTSTVTRRTETMHNDTKTTTLKLALSATIGVDTTLQAPSYGTTSQSSLVYTTATTSESSELFRGTDSTLPTTSFSTTHKSSTISEASGTSRSTTLKADESNTTYTDATMLTGSSTTPSQSSTIYSASAVSKSTSLDLAKSTTASEHQSTTASLLSSYHSARSFKNFQDLIDAEQAATRVTAMDTSYKTSSQSPFVRRTDITEDLASLTSANSFSTENYLTTNMTSIPSRDSVSSTGSPLEKKRDVDTTYKTEPQSIFAYTTMATHKPTTMQPSEAASEGKYGTTTTTPFPPHQDVPYMNDPLRLTRTGHSTTTADAATVTVSSETIQGLSLTHKATIAHGSTALKSSGRPPTSTDAEKYHAITETTSQFVTPTINATENKADEMETEEAATTTGATTMITTSHATPQSSPLSDTSIGKKSTILVKNTTTTADTTKMRAGFGTTPKSSLSHSSSFTSESTALKATESADAGEYHTVATFTSSSSSSGISSTLGTDAGTLMSNTRRKTLLHSYDDVFEEHSTTAYGTSTGEMTAPAEIEETTSRYHDDVHCNRNIFSLYNLSDILHVSDLNQTVGIGQTIEIGCHSSGGDENITLTCGKTGVFVPSPSALNCSSDIKTPWTTRELNSCEQCDAYGTESCEKKEDGVVCHCYEHWSGKTCWRAPDQCKLTHLQCGKHGFCRSEVDYASCVCDYGFTGEFCTVNKTNTTIASPNNFTFGDLASEASVLVLTWNDVVVMAIKSVLLIQSPSVGEDPQTHYQNCRSFVMILAGFLALFFRHPTLFSLSYVECQWVFYIISCCCSLGIAFFAVEAFNAYELCSLEQLNSWTTLFPERPRSYALLAFRTVFPVVAMAFTIPVIMVPKYEQAICPWSCMGRFPQEMIDLWSPIVLIGMCIALIASAFSYRGLFIRKNLPHNLKKVEAYLENVSVRRRNEVEKCERDLLFTAIGPWLLLLYWITLMMSNDFVAIPGTGLLALSFAVLYSTCNFTQSVFTTPAKYSNFMWYLMRYAPANYAPKFDPVTRFSRDEVLEVLHQKEIDAEKRNNSKAKGLLIWNSTFPDYLPTCLRSIMLKEWTDSYLNARNSGKAKVEACYAVYKQHVLEMDPHTLHGKQTRKLFLDWNVHIRQADPLPEPKEERLSLDKKLKHDFIAAMRNVFAPIGHERRDTVSGTSMAEKVDFHIPLCSIVTIDKQGYVIQVNVLKAPVKVKSKEGRLLWKTDPNNDFIGGDSDRNYEWAMTSDEKIEAATEEQADTVWDMAVQNHDFIQYSKALRI